MAVGKEFTLRGKAGYDISCIEWPCERERATLVCLHGFAGDKYSSVIRALGEALAQRSVRTVAFDWPGHGKSPVDGASLTVENCLLDLDSVLREIQKTGRPVYLFATSFGGFVGLNYMALHPAAFSKAALRSPALDMPKTYRSLLTDGELRTLENGGTVNKGFDRPLLLGKSFLEDLDRRRIPRDAYPADVPGLILQGDRDDVVNPLDSAAFAERNGLRLHMVKGADHRYKNKGDLEEILSVTIRFLLD